MNSLQMVHETVDYLNTGTTTFNYQITKVDDTSPSMNSGFNLSFNIEFIQY